MTTAELPHVVIIGCGFGGLEAAKRLAHAPVRVTVIDRANHHLFQPLLYQVATAGLPAPSVAAPIRHILRKQRNTTVLLGEVSAIDVAARALHIDDGPAIGYDALIVATGATHSYFGNPQWEADAPGLKTLEDAYRIRARFLDAFERAELETDEATRRALLTFVVIGAGATGVEMAGTMAEIAHLTLPEEFRRIRPASARVLLLEGGERVLPVFVPELSARAQRQLEALGVEVQLNARVTAIDAQGVSIGADRIAAHTVVWAAGVRASAVGAMLGVPLDRAGRVVVQPDLSIPGQPRVFCIGDLAAAVSDGKPVPGVSPAAKQMGRLAAANALRVLAGAAAESFRYRDYGSLATIGRHAAVVDIAGFKLSGVAAWWLWLCAHVYFLIGFRNRLTVMIDWAWSYWTMARYARIFLPGEGKRAR